MRRQALTIGAVAATLALSVVGPAWAAPQAGSRPNTGETVGSAAPRGGGESGSSGATSSSTSSGSSSSPSGSSMGGSSAASPWGGAGGAVMRREAPERPAWAADQRRGGGDGGARDRAVLRGSAISGGASGGASAMPMTTGVGATSRSASGPNRSAVPDYSRPRGTRPVIGTAGEREALPPGTGGGFPPYSPIYYDPYYYYGYGGYYGSYYGSYYGYCRYPYGAYNPFCGTSWGYAPWLMPGYGFGFGFFGYDPWSDPFGYGYAADPYDYQGGGGGGGYSSSAKADTGALHLRVKPGNAEVFVDGYYVGTVDSFNGAFQKLTVAAGAHKIELRADGYQPETFEVLVKPGETVAYKGEMKRVQ